MVAKNMLIGALATGLVDATLEGYFGYMAGQGKAPANQFPYIVIPGAEWLPPGDDWLAWAGTPLVLYAMGKLMKKPALIEMSKGGAIYGVSAFVGQTTLRVSYKLQGKLSTPMTYQYVLR